MHRPFRLGAQSAGARQGCQGAGGCRRCRKAKAAKGAAGGCRPESSGGQQGDCGTLRAAELAVAVALGKARCRRQDRRSGQRRAPPSAPGCTGGRGGEARRRRESRRGGARYRSHEDAGGHRRGADGLGSREGQRTRPPRALKATERNTEPISIFVSKKAGRVYIRQAWAPIHEAPATFKDPQRPSAPTSMLPRRQRTTGGPCAGCRCRCRRRGRAEPRQGGKRGAAAQAPPAASRHARPQLDRRRRPACSSASSCRGNAKLHRRQAVGRCLADRLRPGHQPRDRVNNRLHRADPLARRTSEKRRRIEPSGALQHVAAAAQAIHCVATPRLCEFRDAAITPRPCASSPRPKT